MTPRARGLEGHLQVVLDHHGEAAELLFLVVRIDCGLFDQRVPVLPRSVPARARA